jgi:hypothetical protein
VRIGLLALPCLCACLGVPAPSRCVFDDECGAGNACFEGACTPGAHLDGGGVGWCPTLQPKLSDITERLFRVSCGSKTSYCHNSDAATGPTPASGLDFSGDVYSVLVNVTAENVAATAKTDGGPVTRVIPGDPQNSFLGIKLRLKSNRDPFYGSGMPPEHPGGVCQTAQDAVAQWIAQGAQRN